ncbi:MAG: ABC-type transport auxiliary lipoprotein family protein [Desulfovibrio sp.]
MRNTLYLILCVLAAVALWGCGGIKKTGYEKRFYVLDVAAPEVVDVQTREKATSDILTVRRVQVSPQYDHRDLIYKRAGGHIESDFYNAFFSLPSAMITQQLHSYLDKTHLYKEVITTDSLVESSIILETNIAALYWDVTGVPKAVVEFEFFLLDDRTAEKIILTHKVVTRVPAPRKDPDALIAAMSKALGKGFGELTEKLRNHLNDGVVQQ